MFIFDEPSSSLDAEAEAELLKRLEQLYHYKGAVLISHRLSNLSSADIIYVLDSRKVIEQGTQNELMKINGKFASMYRLQADKYSKRAEPND